MNTYDLITIGRVSMDLFAEDIGADFTDITRFETGVGGSPTNIAIGASRLGLRTALLTAVGADEVGRFVLRYLQREKIDTQFIPKKANARTGMAVVGVQPPANFPLVFYREDPADIYLTIEDAARLPFDQTRAVLLSGTALSRGTCCDATLYAAEQAAQHSAKTFMDLDLRPDQWSHPGAFGLNIRTVLPRLDVIIGTEEECYAALASDPEHIMAGEKVTASGQKQLVELLRILVDRCNGPDTVILKRGERGVTIFSKKCSAIDVAGFPVEILNTVGAGDAFASGLIYAYLQGWDWCRAARFANACGAIVVTRHGCGTAMPALPEVMNFLAERGEI